VIMAVMVMVRGQRMTWTDRPLCRMCVMRTAAQREVQQKSCGCNKGDERTHRVFG